MRVRTKARESALQILFCCDFHDDWSEATVVSQFAHFDVPAAAKTYAVRLVHGVAMNLELINAIISMASTNWSLSRMGRVDRAVLRLAAFELIDDMDVPKNVIINEAVELAKRFGSSESRVFVNGVLDYIGHSTSIDGVECKTPDLTKLSSVHGIEVDRVAA